MHCCLSVHIFICKYSYSSVYAAFEYTYKFPHDTLEMQSAIIIWLRLFFIFLHFTVKVIKNTNRKQTENANKANGNKATIL